MPSKPELMTASRYRSVLKCPRYHYYAYELGYRTHKSSTALQFGTLMHAALETWWLTWKTGEAGQAALDEALEALHHASIELMYPLDPYVRTQIEALMIGYHHYYAPNMAEIKVLAVEEQFKGRTRVPGWCLSGKIDAIIKRRGRVYLVEHKTTSTDVTPGSAYWIKLRMDPQISFYHHGARMLGYEVEGCIYDVICKPTINPYKATPEADRKYRKEDNKLYASQHEHDEPLDAYAERLGASIAKQPSRYYKRAEVVRLDSELESARADVYAALATIEANRRHDQIPARNTEACHRYGTPCEYFDVCSGAARIDNPRRFKRLGTKHPELDI